jgi:hypothetical protein
MVTGGAPAGARALRHALDLLELGRVRRALVAVPTPPATTRGGRHA